MSSPHVSMKSGKAGKGSAHASYIAGVGKYADREDVIEMLDRNMPVWAKDGADFFAAADKLERANGRTYSEIEAAIPRAVADPIAYATEYAEKLLGTDHPYRMAVHDKPAADGGRNIHMHLMFSERKHDGIERDREQFFKRAAAPYRDRKTKQMMPADPAKGGTAKDRKWNERKHVQVVRDGWQEFAKAHGIELDLRSNSAKGLGAPEPKLGPQHPRAGDDPAREARRIELERLRDVRAVRAELQEINHQEKKHDRAEHQKTRHHQPAAGVAEMRDVWGVDNVHDVGRTENVLQPDAPGDIRPQPAAADPARLHELATARAVAEAKAQAAAQEAARATQERAQAVSDAKAQAAAERKAAWIERGQRRRAGTPNRVIRLDQSHQGGRTEYRWAGNGPAAGKVAVIQTGNQLAAAGRYSAPKAAAMAQIAKDNGWQSVTITGDAAFKAMALPELLSRGIVVSNPELQPQVHAFQAKAAADAKARAVEADRQAMEKYWADRAQRDAARQQTAEAKAQADAAAQREQQPPQVAKPAAPARPAPDPYLGMNNTQRILAERAAERTKRLQREAAAELSNPNLSGAAGPLILPPAEPPTLLDRLASSWAAMVVWIKEKGPLASLVDVDTERSMNDGQIVQIDDLHAIQKTGRTTFAIHRLDALDRVPPSGMEVNIKYQGGRGTVSTGPDRGDRKGGVGR